MRTRTALALGALTALAGTGAASGDVKIDKVSCLDLPSCYRLANGTVEAIVTTDVGPRVIAYRFVGGENVFRERPSPGPRTEWKSYGGHRLWAAPEQRPRTYFPDNDPVPHAIEAEAGAIRLTPAVEAVNGIQKAMRVVLDREGTGVTIEHTITNTGAWPIELAPWAITVLPGGGEAIVPQEPASEGLLPVRSMALWGYTVLNDPRLTFGRGYVRVKAVDAEKRALKIGFGNTRGWAAYHRAGTLFLKRFAYEAAARYPDYGSNNEIYTNGGMLEVETLAPLQKLEPGAAASHVERWSLHRVDLGAPATDAEIDAALQPIVRP
jgi:hypothetical protein